MADVQPKYDLSLRKFTYKDGLSIFMWLFEVIKLFGNVAVIREESLYLYIHILVTVGEQYSRIPDIPVER